MKTLEVTATFPSVSLTQFKQHMFDDPNFQRLVQEKMGQTNVQVGTWEQLPSPPSANKKLSKRVITFDAPVSAPAAVQSFLGMKTVNGVSTATMSVVGNVEMIEGSTVMQMLSGLLKDALVITVQWTLMPSTTDKSSVTMKVVIKCEYNKWVPIVGSLIESTCASNAQKTYETWISMAKDVCKNTCAMSGNP